MVTEPRIAKSFSGFSLHAVTEGDMARALRLAGAADALRESMGLDLPFPPGRKRYEEGLKPATEVLRRRVPKEFEAGKDDVHGGGLLVCSGAGIGRAPPLAATVAATWSTPRDT